jgi:hypothetical protein
MARLSFGIARLSFSCSKLVGESSTLTKTLCTHCTLAFADHDQSYTATWQTFTHCCYVTIQCLT